MHGATEKLMFPSGASLKIQRAFVFVPLNPTASKGGRGVGAGPKMGMALHELLHAAGLEATDPSHTAPLSQGDIYMTKAVVQVGATPAQDQYVFGPRLEPDIVGHFTLSAATVQAMQSIWLLGQF